MIGRLRRIGQRWSTLLKVSDRPDLVRVGSDYGGWVVPASLLSPSAVCYCAGVGEDITFDLALIDRFGCHVFAFDPTPRAAAHVQAHAVGREQFHFLPVGLWSSNRSARFFAPQDPAHVSHSVVNLQGTGTYFEAPCLTCARLMQDLGHTELTLLKMDIEGAEYDVIRNIIADELVIEIICVEYHDGPDSKQTRQSVASLVRYGYSLVSVDGNNYTLVLGRCRVSAGRAAADAP